MNTISSDQGWVEDSGPNCSIVSAPSHIVSHNCKTRLRLTGSVKNFTLVAPAGKRSLGGKGKSFSGGTGPKGQWGDRISTGKGGWEEKGGDLGGKRP